jgi:signal transduction histidine kinase
MPASLLFEWMPQNTHLEASTLRHHNAIQAVNFQVEYYEISGFPISFAAHPSDSARSYGMNIKGLVSVQPAVESALPLETDLSLPRHWIRVGRVTWLALSLLGLGILVASLLPSWSQLQTLCRSNSQNCSSLQLTPAQAQTLHATLGLSLSAYATFVLCLSVASALFWMIGAGVLLWRKFDLVIVLVMALQGVTQGSAGGSNGLGDILVQGHPLWVFPVSFLEALNAILLFFVFALFPDGRFAPRWMRWVAVTWIALNVLYCAALFYPLPALPPYMPLFFGFIGSLIFAQLYRYLRVSSPVQRQQTKWVIFSFALIIVSELALMIPPLLFAPLQQPGSLYGPATIIINIFVLLLGPIATLVAVLRYRLWDIDIIINRTLVYGTLTTCAIGIYVLVIVSIGTLLQAQGNFLIALLATGLVAVLFQPLRERLQKTVNRLMFGERDDPYGVLSRLGQRLEATLAPDAVMTIVVETMAQALKLPYVALALKQGDTFTIAVSSGTPVETTLRLPLLYQNETIGELLLAPRTHGDTFTPSDHRLLNDLARQAGIAVHAVRLTADLQYARERLVTTREEERRRLRRDLHDGLGPTLAGLSLKVGAVRNLLPPDQSSADRLLLELNTDIEEAVRDIRRIVYDLRPPSLDELGLVGAIRARAAQYNTGLQHGNPQILVEAPEYLLSLPAAVEVAAYRIVQEALTNIVRHAEAYMCIVRLTLSDRLYLEITDDGRGLPEKRHTGVGLIAMHERAAELGGSCTIEAVQPKGTRVFAQLPLAKE